MVIADVAFYMIPAGGLMFNPFRGHSEKKFPPMCQHLQNAAPPYDVEVDVPAGSPCVLS